MSWDKPYGKEYKKEHIYICITESFCCPAKLTQHCKSINLKKLAVHDFIFSFSLNSFGALIYQMSFILLSFPAREVILTSIIILQKIFCLSMNRVQCLLTCFSADIYEDRLHMRKWGKTSGGDNYTIETMLDKFIPKFLHKFGVFAI